MVRDESIRISGLIGVHGLGFIDPENKKKCFIEFNWVIRLFGVSPYDTGSSHASDRHWPRVFASRGRKIGLRVR